MSQPSDGFVRTSRSLIIGLVIVLIVLGFAWVPMIIADSPNNTESERVNALANSEDECVTCHLQMTPGIVEQYGYSTMAAAEVGCRDCHGVEEGYPGSIEHIGETILVKPTPATCQPCHELEVEQFYQSRHAAPAYAAMMGVEAFNEAQLAIYEAVPEGSYVADKMRNALYALEGDAITRFACHGCHDIGLPHEDGSIGQCQKCHLRHEFSVEQVRKPETCNACHIGPDHPQWEIYEESAHGIAYTTMGHNWNWEAEAGTQDVTDFPAPQCAICHMSGFGEVETTHDVGDRLSWYLFAPISTRRPNWEENQDRMQAICQECHSTSWTRNFYDDADLAVEAVNDWVRESDVIWTELVDAGYTTPAPFDMPIDFTYFDLWHHWGRTIKFGSWMGGADYVQWHGAYELLRELAEMRAVAEEVLGHPVGEAEEAEPAE